MKRQKGFTLIELLSVLVILGILATVATFVILDYIKKSKQDAILRSSEQIAKAITLDYTTKDNFTTDVIDVTQIDYNGEKPPEGYIQFNMNEQYRLYFKYDNYCVSKLYNTDLYLTELEEDTICDWYTAPFTERVSGTNLVSLDNEVDSKLIYKIYGNSIQNGTPTPDSPVAIESVGDLITDKNDINYGKYKIPIKVIGKNLFDYTSIVNNIVNYDVANATLIEELDNGVIIQGNVGSNPGTSVYSNGWYRPGNYAYEEESIGLNLKAGDVVTVSADYTILEKNYSNPISIHLYGTVSKTGVAFDMPELNVKTRISYKYTIKSDGVYYPAFTLNSNKVKIENIQITKNGDIMYEPYREEITNIYLDEPLRKVADYADYIDLDKQKVIRFIKEETFTGNERWMYNSFGKTTERFWYLYKSPVAAGLCNIGVHNALAWNGTVFDVQFTLNEVRFYRPFYTGLLTTEASVQNWKKYLNERYTNSTPITVNYVLATPIEENIDLLDIDVTKGNNVIMVDTTVPSSKIEIISIEKND